MTRRNAQHRPARSGWLARPGWLVRPAWLARLEWPTRPGWPATSIATPARRRWVAAAGLLTLFGLGAAVAFAIAGAGQPGPGPRPAALAHPDPDATEAVPHFHVPAPVNPVALPSTGAIPMPAGEQPQARTWSGGRGGAAFKAVSSQAGDVAQASGQRSYVAMKADCAQLASAVAAAQTAPPIPDASAQQLYQQALSGFGKAASQCQSAISEQPDGDEYVATTEDKPVLNEAESMLDTATRQLFRATGGIVVLGSRH